MELLNYRLHSLRFPCMFLLPADYFIVHIDCDIRGCLNCTAAGVCYECSRGLTLNKKSTGCVKECSRADPDFKTPVCREGKRKDKKGKNKRKGKLKSLTTNAYMLVKMWLLFIVVH